MGSIGQDFNNDFDIGTNVWPLDLPQCPLLDNFIEKKQTNVVSFKPEVGTTKLRRRASESLFVASMVFGFNTNQLASFQTFFKDTCQDGSVGFQFAHPVTKTLYWWMFNKKEAPVIERVSPRKFLVRFDLVNMFPIPAEAISLEYVIEDGTASYAAEDGTTIYVPSN